MEENKILNKDTKKCKGCGGNLKFSAEDCALKCENCNMIEKIEFTPAEPKHDYTDDIEDSTKRDEWKSENKIFKCENCGASVVLNSLEVSKKCPYCASPYVAKPESITGIVPDSVIPFAFGKEKASDLYKANVKKKWFIPNAVKKCPPMDTMSGIYVPSFSYDSNTSSTYSATLGKTETYRDANGNTQSSTSYDHVSGVKNLNLKDIIVEASSHIDGPTFKSIGAFDLSQLKKYNNGFIMGYSVETYNQSVAACKKISESMMESIIKSDILAGYSYDFVESFDMKTTYSNNKYSYYLLPTYKVDYKYKDKNYTTFMNGQTGKVGSGLPISAVKVTFFVLTIILIVFGAAILYFMSNMQ